MLKDFYQILFDAGQATCFSASLKGTAVTKVKPRTDCPYFTINALDPRVDHSPTEEYHRADRPRRADHNVVCFRNILIEMDIGGLDQQLLQFEATQIPFSTCVMSGGKSLHFIISLVEPVADRMAYARLVKQVYKALAPLVAIDQANKNPSRFSRCPGALRPEKNTMQKLVIVKGRVANAQLEQWIAAHTPVEKNEDRFADGGQLLFLPSAPRVFETTKSFLEKGAPQGEWNNSLFRAACNLFSMGISLEEATDQFRAITGTLDSSDLSTIHSAYRRARQESSPSPF